MGKDQDTGLSLLATVAVAELLEFGDDTCSECGKLLGHGMKLFHLGRCKEHAEFSEDDGEEIKLW